MGGQQVVEVVEERLREMSAVAMSGLDEILGMPSSWALGYAIGRPGSDAKATPTVFGMPSAAESAAYADTATGISFALTKNRLTADFDAVNHIRETVAKPVAAYEVRLRSPPIQLARGPDEQR